MIHKGKSHRPCLRVSDHSRRIRPPMSDQDYLWLEKEIKSVAKLTGRNIEEFLPIALEIAVASQEKRLVIFHFSCRYESDTDAI